MRLTEELFVRLSKLEKQAEERDQVIAQLEQRIVDLERAGKGVQAHDAAIPR